MPKEDFKKAVEKELTGRETEPWEIIYAGHRKGDRNRSTDAGK